MPATPPHRESPWPHRLAVALCCATFPLIWLGGLVTTYDAGMAVPDWPSTYGYNLFLYPWTTWLFGPWDLLIEHGHRLLAAGVGLLTIALVAAMWRWESRSWVRWMAVIALLLVIVQGLLGGARVVFNARQIAMIHGCVGPAFFAFSAALAVCTSAFWHREPPPAGSRLQQTSRVSVATAILAYCQLIFGAQLRHLPVTASPGTFQVLVWFHLLLAAVLTLQILRLAKLAWSQEKPLFRPASALVGLVVLQLCLGGGTWIVKYGWPHWFSDWRTAAEYTVQTNSVLQAAVVTGHVAIGSLILATSVCLAVRAARSVRVRATALGSGALLAGVVG